MKSFLAFLKKEIYHIIRDVRTLIILFGMPIVLVILFGFAITTEIKNSDIAVFDKSKDQTTLQIINKINSSSYFNVNQYLVNDYDIEKYLRAGKGKAVLIFENNFEISINKKEKYSVMIITDAIDPNSANTIRTYLSSILNDYQIKNNLSKNSFINIETKMLYNPKLEGAFYFVPGVITVILMLVSAMMTSITIAREKEFGTMELLLVSPLNPFIIVLGKSIPYILLALINAISVLIIGYTIFGMPLTGNLLLLLSQCLLFVLTSLSIGILISTIVSSQQLALMISLVGLMMPTMLLSGFIYPIESMPEILQYLSNIVPARWFIVIIKNIMIKGVGFEAIWKESLILLVMLILFLALSIKKFKIRLA